MRTATRVTRSRRSGSAQGECHADRGTRQGAFRALLCCPVCAGCGGSCRGHRQRRNADPDGDQADDLQAHEALTENQPTKQNGDRRVL